MCRHHSMVKRDAGLDGNRERAVNLHCNALLEHVDGEDEEALAVLDSQEDALDVRHRAADDPHALALFQIRVRSHRHPGIHHAADRLDLVGRHHGPPIPPVTENADEAPRFADLHVDVLIEHVVQEEVAGEHRDPDAAAEASASGPHLDRGQKRMKSLRRQLLMHQLLAMASRPEDEPPGLGDRAGRVIVVAQTCFSRSITAGCQGFAPFAWRLGDRIATDVCTAIKRFAFETGRATRCEAAIYCATVRSAGSLVRSTPRAVTTVL